MKVQVAEVWMNDFLLYISIVVRLIPVSFVFKHVWSIKSSVSFACTCRLLALYPGPSKRWLHCLHMCLVTPSLSTVALPQGRRKAYQTTESKSYQAHAQTVDASGKYNN